MAHSMAHSMAMVATLASLLNERDQDSCGGPKAGGDRSGRPASWGVLCGHCGPSTAFARGPSNLKEQLWEAVWEADGGLCLSWLIICPARRLGELFGDPDELGEAVPDN